MICYIYDGSFEGLLTAVYESYYMEKKPEEILKQEHFLPDFFIEPIYINTSKEKADKVYNAVKDKISYEVLEYVFHVFLSELKESSTLIYRYLKLAFKIGKDINLHMYNSIVLSVHRISDKVTHEAHRMTGFIRFKFLASNVYYAAMEPDNNILQLIMPHFSKRFSSQNFIIHDRKREIAALYNKENWVIIHMLKADGEKLFSNGNDEVYEKLWIQYFSSITIENRENRKLQKRCMPERYWKFLTEML